MNLNYRFKHVKLDTGVFVKEPIIRVSLLGSGERKLNFTAILDTGSDFVLLPLEVAEALGLKFDVAKKESARMYSGTEIATTQSKVRVKIERHRESIALECRCAVWLNKQSQHEHIIFGSSFLEHFKAIFDYPKNSFQLKR